MLYTQNIFNDYLNRNIFRVFLLTSTGMLFFLLFSRSIQLFEKAAADLLDPLIALKILVLRIPDFLTFIIPISFFVSLLVNLGSLYRNNGYLIFFSAGKSNTYLFRTIFGQGALILFCLLSLGLLVAPISKPLAESLYVNQGIEHRLELLSSNRIHNINQSSKFTFQSRGSQPNTFKGVTFFSIQDSGALIISSEEMTTAIKNKKLYLDFRKGSILIDSFDSQSSISFDKHTTHLNLEEELSLAPSFRKILDSDDQLGFSQEQWNYSFILLFLNLFLFAFAFSQTRPRESNNQKFVLAGLLFLIYLTFLIAYRNSYTESSNALLYLALWPIHAGFSALGLLILFKSSILRNLNIFNNPISKFIIYISMAFLFLWLIF
ncbi:MAG: LptF/LptG family permease [Gammaproteobacteria bacterium]|jgi:lipopolysaccharide export system permease protein